MKTIVSSKPKKWVARSAETNGARIRCPEHGLQLTYDLYGRNRLLGLGCEKDYSYLPIKADDSAEE